MTKKHWALITKCIYALAVISAEVALSIFFYPDISDAWNRYVSSKLISEYTTNTVEEKDYSSQINAAREYNRLLYEGGKGQTGNVLEGQDDITDTAKEAYETQVSVMHNGMMGYIEIPAIGIKQPIYHYATEEILGKGIGHLYGTSLPVGGTNSHAVLTGHSGMVQAKLFTSLEELKTGDRFSIHTLGMTLNYEVDQILTVLPTETEEITIHEGRDEVTLVTCTPYGVNTHRLLVRGHRIADDAQTIREETPVRTVQEVVKFPVTIFALYGAMILAGIIALVLIFRGGRKTRTNYPDEDSKEL